MESPTYANEKRGHFKGNCVGAILNNSCKTKHCDLWLEQTQLVWTKSWHEDTSVSIL